LLVLATLGCFFLVGNPAKRIRVLTATIIGVLLSLPGLLYLNSAGPASDLQQQTSLFGRIAQFNPGFLYASVSWKEFPITTPFLKWCAYWFLQLGLLPFVAFAGWMLAGRASSFPQEIAYGAGSFLRKRLYATRQVMRSVFRFIFSEYRIWGVVGLAIFALANLFTFSPEVAANHKLINYPIIIADIYAALFLAYLLKKRTVFKLSAFLLAFTLMLGGVADIFPIFNSNKIPWHDVERDATAFWILNNTAPQARFFNLTYETAPLAVSGRRVYWGWDYFPWSLGYDLPARKAAARDIITGAVSKAQVCAFLRQNKLAFVYMDAATAQFMDAPINRQYFTKHFIKVSPDTLPYAFYDVEKSCTSV